MEFRRGILGRLFACGLVTAFSIAGMSEGAAQAAGSQRTVVRVPPTIDAAGLRDVTAALQAFLDSVPDGATIEFPDSARYRAEGGLAFVNRRGLTLEGHGATILATTDGRAVPWPQGLGGSRKRWPRTRRHLLFVGGENIAVRNLVIKGAHPAGGVGEAAYVKALEAQHGFEFRGVQGVELDRVTVTDVYGDFVYLGGYAGSWTRKVHIHDSRFERNGWQGIAVTWAEDVLIERNHLGQSRRAMLDLEPHNEQGGARRIVVRNNTFGPGRLFFLASKGRGSNIEDVTIEGNRLSRALNIYVVPPSGHRRARFRIVNNVSEDRQGGPPGLFFYMGSPPALMTFERIDGLEVRGNTNRLPFAPQMIGVRASESCRVIVTANDFPGATQDSEVHPHGCP